jgi:hypothetical protein
VATDGARSETSVSVGAYVAAVAGLLSLGDPASESHVDGWIASAADDPDLDDVIRGLAIEGLAESMPAIVRICDAVVAAGAPGFEPQSACLAVAIIFRKGGGAEYPDFVRRMMAVPDCDAAEQGSLALLVLGDNGAVDGVLAALERGVTRPTNDPEFTTMILEVVADKKLAGSKKLTAAVDVGAQLRPDETMSPGPRDRAIHVNCAAAYAYLASR